MLSLEAEVALVERAKSDQTAFRELYEQNLPGLYRYAYYRTSSKELAEDVVSQTFMQVWQNLSRYQHRGIPFNHWLYRIAGNILASNAHRRLPFFGLPEDRQEAAVAPESEQVDLRVDLLRRLRELPDLQQQVIVLRYVQGLTLEDVAAITHKSQGAVKQLAFRGLKTLRERMVGYEA
jgi:RNA polymerase sigma-70 factor (ECF subfamily)